MKRNLLPPLAVLAAVLAFSLWTDIRVTQETDRWGNQLQQADALAQAQDWTGALEALEESYQDWKQRQTYLHIVASHNTVDDAETMYRRAMAFAQTQEITEFRAELSDLRDQLRLLAETEHFSLGNVLAVLPPSA